MRRTVATLAAALWVAVLAILSASVALAQPWSFGVMTDTQWSPAVGRAGKGVATEIVDDINKQFIKAGVKFVIQVGDLANNDGSGALDELDIRAAHTHDLQAAGIRFFPLRGNHDASLAAARRFSEAFPGLPGTPGFQATDGFSGASSPDLPGLAGHTYAFTYANATFILLDQFTVDNGSPRGKAYPIRDQQGWITSQLAGAAAEGRHAFVFAHKNLLGQSHKDNLFGSPASKDDPGDANPATQPAEIAFIRAMAENGARFYISGHDHVYHRSLVTSPDPEHRWSVEQIIGGSCSYKFYEPRPPFSANERTLAEHCNTIGYLIVTVDGTRATGRYYAAPGIAPDDKKGVSLKEWRTPATWTLQDTFGYDLNEKQSAAGHTGN